MLEYTYTDELYHYGVLGMKWGVRRSPKVKAERQRYKSANKEIKTMRKLDLTNRRSFSDADLERKIKRLKMEKEFKKLTEEDVKPGRTAVKNFIKSNGGKVISTATVGGLTYLGKYAMTKDFNVGEAANYMFSNPKKK